MAGPSQQSFGPIVSGANAANFQSFPANQTGGALQQDGLLVVIEFSAAIGAGVGMNYGLQDRDGNGVWEFPSVPTNVLQPIPAGTIRMSLFITKTRCWGIRQDGTLIPVSITNSLLLNAFNPKGSNPNQEVAWYVFVGAAGAGITSTIYASYWN